MRLESMKSELHQRGFLSVRKLLQERGYTDFDLYYDADGKPHLKDGRHVSISHSHEFSTIILSDENCGIDLEMQRDKIITIAHKFAAAEDGFLNHFDQKEYIRQLTVIWGAKEAIFKARNEVGISFKDHIYVQPFSIDTGSIEAILNFGAAHVTYDLHFKELENYTVVYGFQRK